MIRRIAVSAALASLLVAIVGGLAIRRLLTPIAAEAAEALFVVSPGNRSPTSRDTWSEPDWSEAAGPWNGWPAGGGWHRNCARGSTYSPRHSGPARS